MAGVQKVQVAGLVALEGDGPRNWLLVGTDSRDGISRDDPNAGAFLAEPVEGNRTDTMMILRVDDGGGAIDLVSVPRDLWVPIAGTDRSGRINGAFNGADGRDRLIVTLGTALEVPIHHYVEVDFVGFQRLIDVMGGVPVWFDHPARDSWSGLGIAEAGCHVLDGSQGLAFARARNFEELVNGQWLTEPTGDLGRTARQRLFLGRLLAAAADRSIVGKVRLLGDGVDVVGDNLVVGDTASTGDLIGLARTLSSVGSDRIVGHALPVEDFRTGGGAQVLRLQEPDAQAVLDVFRAGGGPAAPEAAPVELSSEQPVVEQADAAPTVADDQPVASGYGRFGFVPGSDPVGTPCE